MRILTIEIDNETDLAIIKRFLDDLEIRYHLDDTNSLDESIRTGLGQSRDGRTKPLDEVMQNFRVQYQIPDQLKAGIEQGQKDIENGNAFELSDFEEKYKHWLKK